MKEQKVVAADVNLDVALETKRIIEAEGGICEAVTADVSRADDDADMVISPSRIRPDRCAAQQCRHRRGRRPGRDQRGEKLGQGQRRKPEEHVSDANSILPGMMNTPMVHAAEVIAA